MASSSLVDAAIALLDYIPPGDRFSWNFRQRDLLSNIIRDGGLENFLQWPVSAEALHAGYTDFAAAERGMIDESLRYLAKDPLAGNPPGARSPEKSSGTYIRQLLVALLIEQHLMPIRDIEWLFEFGGGYGALAVVLDRLGFRGLHYVYDLPAVHYIRSWYLSNFYIITESIASLENTILEDVDVFVSICSMDEVGESTRETVLDAVDCDNYLFWFHKHWDGVNNYDWFMNWIDSRDMSYAEIEIPNENQCCVLAKKHA